MHAFVLKIKRQHRRRNYEAHGGELVAYLTYVVSHQCWVYNIGSIWS
jgi:hypothetical protein